MLVVIAIIVWLGSFAAAYYSGALWAPLIVMIPLAIAIGVFIFAWRQRAATEDGGQGLGPFSFIMHTVAPVVIVVLVYQIYAGLAPEQRHIIIEKTTTLMVTDRSDSALIEAKYVATDDFWRYFAVVLLVGAFAQGIYFLARGYAPVEVVLLVISAGIAFLLFLPNYSNIDPDTAIASNLLFLWGALGTTIWSILTGGVDLLSSTAQEGAHRLHPRIGLAAAIILAPVGIVITLSPDALVMAAVTRAVHETALTMNQALILVQQGALFGIFCPGALRELISIAADLNSRIFDKGEFETEGEE